MLSVWSKSMLPGCAGLSIAHYTFCFALSGPALVTLQYSALFHRGSISCIRQEELGRPSSNWQLVDITICAWTPTNPRLYLGA